MRVAVSAPFDAVNRTRPWAVRTHLSQRSSVACAHGGGMAVGRPAHVITRAQPIAGEPYIARPAGQSPPSPPGSVGALSASTSSISRGSARRIYLYMSYMSVSLPDCLNVLCAARRAPTSLYVPSSVVPQYVAYTPLAAGFGLHAFAVRSLGAQTVGAMCSSHHCLWPSLRLY